MPIEDRFELQQSATEAAAAIAAGVALTRPYSDEGGALYQLLPPGYKLQAVDVYRALPQRARGWFEAHDPASFLAETQRLSSEQPAARLVCADTQRFWLSAILNAHTASVPGWCDFVLNAHTASVPGWCDFGVQYQARVGERFAAWLEQNDKLVAQAEFAQWLEDRVGDIVGASSEGTPSGAEMLQLALNLQARSEVNYSQVVRLDNGQVQLQYQEQITASGGAMKVPGSFAIVVPVFEHTQALRIPVALRYRLREQKLSIGFHMAQPQEIKKEAFAQLCAQVGQALQQAVMLGVQR